MDIKDFYKALIIDRTEEEGICAYLLRLPEDGTGEAVLNLDVEKHPNLELETRISEGQPLEFRILFGSRGIECYRGIVSYVLTEHLHIKNIALVRRIQRRNDVKAPMVYDGMIFKCPEPEETKRGMRFSGNEADILSDVGPVEKQNTVDVVFRDISAGGVGFRVPSSAVKEGHIKIGGSYGVWFEKGKQKFPLIFRLIRVEEERDGYLNCGGRFIGITAEQEVLIRQYVFQMESAERERVKRLRELIMKTDKGILENLENGEEE